jgi:HD superfamily phosphohydrolase
MFHHRSDMIVRVYAHRTVQALDAMIEDALLAARSELRLEERLMTLEQFIELDDRILYAMEKGKLGSTAQKIANDIAVRRLYQCVGELVTPYEDTGLSQTTADQLENELKECSNGVENLRVVRSVRRYTDAKKHPLKLLWFYGADDPNKRFRLTDEEMSSIVPIKYKEVILRVFVGDKTAKRAGEEAFREWKRRELERAACSGCDEEEQD